MGKKSRECEVVITSAIQRQLASKKAIETVRSDDLTVVAMAGRLLGGNGSKGSGEWLRNDLNGDAQGIDRHTKCDRQKRVSNEWQKMGAKAEPMTAGKDD